MSRRAFPLLALLAASCVGSEEQIELPPCEREWPHIPWAGTETGGDLPLRTEAMGSGRATIEIVDPDALIGIVEASRIASTVLRLRFPGGGQPVLVLLEDMPFTLTSSIVDAEIVSWLESFTPILSIELRDPETSELLLASWLNTRGRPSEIAEVQLSYEPGSRCRDECGVYLQHRLRASSGSEEVVLSPGESFVLSDHRVTHGFSWTYEERPERCTDQTGRFSGYVVPEP